MLLPDSGMLHFHLFSSAISSECTFLIRIIVPDRLEMLSYPVTILFCFAVLTLTFMSWILISQTRISHLVKIR